MVTEQPRQKRRQGRGGYIATIIVNVIMIYIFNNLLNWKVPFLTDRFSGVLWAFNLSLGATVIANLIFLIYDAGWFRHIATMVLNLIAMFALYLLVTIFPFTFAEEPWAIVIKIVLIIAIAGTGIAFIVELFKLLLGRD